MILRTNKNLKTASPHPSPLLFVIPPHTNNNGLPPCFVRTVPFSNYGVLERDLKRCIASIGVVESMEPFRSHLQDSLSRVHCIHFLGSGCHGRHLIFYAPWGIS